MWWLQRPQPTSRSSGAEVVPQSCPELKQWDQSLCLLLISLVFWLPLWHASSFGQRRCWGKEFNGVSSATAQPQAESRSGSWSGGWGNTPKLCITWHSKYFTYCWFIGSLSISALSLACGIALSTEFRMGSHEYWLNESLYKQMNTSSFRMRKPKLKETNLPSLGANGYGASELGCWSRLV